MPFAVPLDDQGFVADQKMVEGSHRGQGKDHDKRVIPTLDGLETLNPAQGDRGEGKTPREGDLGENSQKQKQGGDQPTKPRKDGASLQIQAQKTDPTAEREREADGWKLNGPNLAHGSKKSPHPKKSA